MRDRLAEFDDNVSVVVVMLSNDGHATGYTHDRGPGPLVLVDPDRMAYRAFGLGRGSVARVWGWRAARRYLQILRSRANRTHGGPRLQRPTEDTLQLGGDFVIDPQGILVYGFWGKGPDDRPAIDDLIQATQP